MAIRTAAGQSRQLAVAPSEEHLREGHRHASAHRRMPKRQRAAIYLVFGAIWLSGCLWLCLDEFFGHRGQFGITPHPWEPAVLLVHGVAAIFGMYLLGWVTARHIGRWWPRRWRRLSGGTLAALFAVLVLSGFALFFLSDDVAQHFAALTHDAVGLGVTVFAIQHWFFTRHRERQ